MKELFEQFTENFPYNNKLKKLRKKRNENITMVQVTNITKLA